MEIGLDGAERAVERACDVGFGHFLVEAKHDHSALDRTQMHECAAHKQPVLDPARLCFNSET